VIAAFRVDLNKFSQPRQNEDVDLQKCSISFFSTAEATPSLINVLKPLASLYIYVSQILKKSSFASPKWNSDL